MCVCVCLRGPSGVLATRLSSLHLLFLIWLILEYKYLDFHYRHCTSWPQHTVPSHTGRWTWGRTDRSKLTFRIYSLERCLYGLQEMSEVPKTANESIKKFVIVIAPIVASGRLETNVHNVIFRLMGSAEV